ncbi:MAG: hypothetical protein IJF54_05985 [Clostridia bacterium]|nr:hypothetical protein [Clostridia bacterium]
MSEKEKYRQRLKDNIIEIIVSAIKLVILFLVSPAFIKYGFTDRLPIVDEVLSYPILLIDPVRLFGFILGLIAMIIAPVVACVFAIDSVVSIIDAIKDIKNSKQNKS